MEQGLFCRTGWKNLIWMEPGDITGNIQCICEKDYYALSIRDTLVVAFAGVRRLD